MWHAHVTWCCDNSVNKPIVGLPCDTILNRNSLQRHVPVSSHTVCHVCDFVVGTCCSDKSPHVTGPLGLCQIIIMIYCHCSFTHLSLSNIPIINRQVSLLKCDQLLFIKACCNSFDVILPDLSWSTAWNTDVLSGFNSCPWSPINNGSNLGDCMHAHSTGYCMHAHSTELLCCIVHKSKIPVKLCGLSQMQVCKTRIYIQTMMGGQMDSQVSSQVYASHKKS